MGAMPIEMLSKPRELGSNVSVAQKERSALGRSGLWMVGPRACSPWAGTGVSEAAFKMPLREKRGRWSDLAVEHKEPKGNAVFGVRILFPGDAAASRNHSCYLASQGYSFSLSVPKLSHCTLTPSTSSQGKGGAVGHRRTRILALALLLGFPFLTH